MWSENKIKFEIRKDLNDFLKNNPNFDFGKKEFLKDKYPVLKIIRLTEDDYTNDLYFGTINMYYELKSKIRGGYILIDNIDVILYTNNIVEINIDILYNNKNYMKGVEFWKKRFNKQLKQDS